MVWGGWAGVGRGGVRGQGRRDDSRHFPPHIALPCAGGSCVRVHLTLRPTTLTARTVIGRTLCAASR